MAHYTPLILRNPRIVLVIIKAPIVSTVIRWDAREHHEHSMAMEKALLYWTHDCDHCFRSVGPWLNGNDTMALVFLVQWSTNPIHNPRQSIRMSNGPSLRKLKPRSARSSCGEETPADLHVLVSAISCLQASPVRPVRESSLSGPNPDLLEQHHIAASAASSTGFEFLL